MPFFNLPDDRKAREEIKRKRARRRFRMITAFGGLEQTGGLPLPDTVAPVLTFVSAIFTDTSHAEVQVSTDEATETIYVVVTTSATQPSAAQIKLGKDHLGATAAFSDSNPVIDIGVQTFTASGLSANTVYYAHFVQEDASLNQSSIVSSLGFSSGGEYWGTRYWARRYWGDSYWGRSSDLFSTAYAAGFEPDWDDALDEGITGDIFLDNSRPNDSGNGTSLATAKKTAAAAVAALSAGQTLRVKATVGSPYRESLDLTGKGGASLVGRTKVLGYSTDKPIFTGFEKVTGWVACDSGDATRVGSNWVHMYKKTGFLKSAIISSAPECLNLHENGTALNEAIDRASAPDPFIVRDQSTWHTADVVYTTGDVPALANNQITGLKDTSVTGAYTQAQIENADVFYVRDPNANERKPVLDFNTGTNILHIEGTTASDKYETSQFKNSWCMINILPAMTQGGYGYWTVDATTIDLYIWPNDAANLTSGIEYSARDYCIYINDESYIELGSLQAVGAAYKDTIGLNHGCGIMTNNGSAAVHTGLVIRNCRSAHHFSTNGASYGAIYIKNGKSCKIWNNRIEKIRGMYGCFINGGVSPSTAGQTFAQTIVTFSNQNPDFGLENDVRYNFADHIEKTPYRFYTQRRTVFAFNKARRAGKGSHPNKLNHYEQSTDNVIWGNDLEDVAGYTTWQEADNGLYAFNMFPSNYSDTDGRAIQDQNHSSACSPQYYLGNHRGQWFFNNTCPPTLLPTYAQNVLLGEAANHTSTFYYMYNTIYHEDAEGNVSMIADRDYNLATKGAAVGAHSQNSSTSLIYTDSVNLDFTFKDTSPTKTMVGRDMRAEIDLYWKPLFGTGSGRAYPFDDWDKDMLGRTIDWGDAPVGHLKQRAVVADVTAPAIVTFSPADGATSAPLTANLILTFDERPIAGAAGKKVTLYKALDDSTIQQFDVNNDGVFSGVTLTFNPTSDFAASTAMYVKADAGFVKDYEGNLHAGWNNATTWNFTSDIGVPITRTYPADHRTDVTNAQTYSFSAMNVATSVTTGNKVSAFKIHATGSTGAALTVTSATIGGVAANIVQTGNTSAIAAILYLEHAANLATKDVSVTFSRTVNRCGIDAVALQGYISATPTDTSTHTDATAGATSTVTLDLLSGGVAEYAAVFASNNRGDWGATVTAEDLDIQIGNEAAGMNTAHYGVAPADEANHVATITWGSTASRSTVGVAWR